MTMITVITPVYNGEKFIESCIKNVVSQNCQKVEHIIVDGGSTDATVNIIKKNAEFYSHIRWVSEKDRGQSDAMNKGIQMARGEIISFLNIDDFYEPGTLNRVLYLFEDLPEPTLLVGNCRVLDDNAELKYINKPRRLKLGQLLLGFNVNPFPINPSAYFYHGSIHDLIGLYDLNEYYNMDVDFLFKAVQKANLKYMNEVWGNYRQIEGTKTFSDLSTGEATKRLEALMNRYRNRLPYLEKWKIKILSKFFQKIDWSRFKYFLDDPENIRLIARKKVARLTRHSK